MLLAITLCHCELVLAGLNTPSNSFVTIPVQDSEFPDQETSQRDPQVAIQLETIMVETQYQPTDFDSSTGTKSIIDADIIEQRHFRSIKDLIRYEPGIAVGNDPQRFGANGFSIRGINGNRVLMQIDGVRLPDAFSIGSFASATRNMVDLDALKAVEIVRGSGAAKFGGDALGGSVNFITKDPADYLDVFGQDHYTDFKLGYNSTNDSFVKTTTLAGSLAELEGLLLLTHSENQETDNKGSNKSLNPTRTAPSPQDNRNFNVLSKVLYHITPNQHLRLSGEWLHSDSKIDAFYARDFDFTNRFVHQMLTNDSQTRWRVALDHSWKMNDFALMDEMFWQIYWQRSTATQITDQDRSGNELTEGRQLINRIFSLDNDEMGGEFSVSKRLYYEWHTHEILFGGQISSNEIIQKRDGSVTYSSGTGDGRFAPGDTSNTISIETFPLRDFPVSTIQKAGVYFQDRISVGQQLFEFIPGGRFEFYHLKPHVDDLFEQSARGVVASTIEGNRFLPKVGGLIHLNHAFAIHGQYTEGFRGPNFSEANLGFINMVAGYQSIPNLNLNPESSQGFEIGLRSNTHIGFFDVTLFRNDYQNFLFSKSICTPSLSNSCGDFNGLLTFQTVNSPDEIRIQGIEFKSEWPLGNFFSPLSGTSLRISGAYSEGKNLTSGTINDQALRNISPMKGVFGLRYQHPENQWGSELILTLVSPKEADKAPEDTQFLPAGYGVLDLNAFYRFGEHIVFNAGVFNLLDKTYIDWEDVNTRSEDPHAALGVFANADLWERYSRPGRNMAVSMRIAF